MMRLFIYRHAFQLSRILWDCSRKWVPASGRFKMCPATKTLQRSFPCSLSFTWVSGSSAALLLLVALLWQVSPDLHLVVAAMSPPLPILRKLRITVPVENFSMLCCLCAEPGTGHTADSQSLSQPLVRNVITTAGKPWKRWLPQLYPFHVNRLLC